MSSIEETIKKNRPNLSSNSIKTYTSTLQNLYKKVYPNDKEIDVKKFCNHKDFINQLKDKEGNKRKSILSALVVICPNDKNQEYRDMMIKDAKQYNEEQLENKKTEKQEENWIEQNEIKKLFYLYQDEANKLFRIKGELTMPQKQTIQNYIIICLTSGIFIPPRRSLDWCLMKWKNYDINKDNYYNKKVFCFNQYKTAKFYHKQDVEVPTTLKSVLNKWIKLIDKNDFLLFDSNNNPLTPVKLNQRLNKIFDGKISVNQLRHSYLTDKYLNKPMTSLKDMKETANEMGHSIEQALEYVKK
jgi:hypothetical protein